MDSRRNEQIKLRCQLISNVGVGLIILAMVLPMLPHQERPWWSLAVTAAGLGIACIAWATWYLGRLLP